MESLSIQTWLAVIVFLFCAPAIADDTDNTNNSFQEVVAKYRAANPKPQLPEEARKFKVQAEFAVQEMQFDKAVDLYGKALDIAPWWPRGHFDRAFILGETKKYREAMSEMKRYLLLVPDAPDTRATQDLIYQWEGVAEPEPEPEADQDIKPTHRVTIGRAFAMGKTEVTQGQWRAIMGNNPSQYPNCGDTCPVEDVSWNDAQAFIQNLNAKTGKQYLLPSEAEWEWVEDSYHDNSNGAPTDGSAWQGDGAKRVLRGGSWSFDPQFARAAIRIRDVPANRFSDFGFRLAMMLP
jgi:tetratricopeptide (TPR) repeat protein